MDKVLHIWKAFADEPFFVRSHIAGRILTCPFLHITRHFPTEGSMLDVGCGYGLLIHLLAKDPARRSLQLCGIDHDRGKIERARRVSPTGADFSTRPLGSFPDASFDIISIIDVLYTIKHPHWTGILHDCRRLLKPGGRILIKEVVNEPRWKHWAIMAQETISVSLLRITKGDRPHFVSPATMRTTITDAGFVLEHDQPLRSLNWINHHLFLGLKADQATLHKTCTHR